MLFCYNKKMKQFIFTLFFFFTFLGASTLHLAISANPARMNPILATDSVSSEISGWVFNSLVTYNKDGKVVPELAKSYRFLDHSTLEFTLRDDVYWSDGVKFSAKDVLFTYEMIISPKIYTPYASSFSPVKSVTVIGKNKILVKYKYPYFKALDIWMMEVLPYHKLKNEKNLMTSKFNQSPIGTGPYTLDKLSISSNIVLHANANYFIHKPKIDEIVYHFVPDPSSVFLMLKSNKLDVGTLSPLQFERQIDDDFKKDFNIYEDIAHVYSYIGFNLHSEKFKNPKIREALSFAIDRQKLVDIMYFGHGKVCNGPFLPGTGAYNNEVKSPEQNLTKARQLLKEAGYDKKHPFVFTLSTNTGPSGSYIAQILQYQLKQAGVIMKLKVMEWQAFLNTVIMPRKFEAVLMAWSLALKPDAYTIWHSNSSAKGGFNFLGYKNEEVDRLIKKAERIINQQKFDKIYRKIFALIVHDNPCLFLVIPNSITVVNKHIHPVSPSLIGITHNKIEWQKE